MSSVFTFADNPNLLDVPSHSSLLELPELPELPQFLEDLPPSSPPTISSSLVLPKKRVRSRSIDEPSASSDPPIFSSDDAPACIDNYATGRRKRQYRGSWWDYSRSSHTPKHELSRNVDSGVWMASEDAEDTDEQPVQCHFLSERIEFPTIDKQDMSFEHSVPPRAPMACTPSEELVARAIVQHCLEHGRMIVDISQLSLSSITDGTLRPLHSMIRTPKAHLHQPDPDAYQSLVPNLQLYLSGNLLRTAPVELWRLETLTVLSLRHNKLLELPSGVARLRNLVELNVASNKLRWLPWELLDLLGVKGNLRRLIVLPNPLYRAINFRDALSEIPWQLLPKLSDLEQMATRLEEYEPHLPSEKGEAIAWILKLCRNFRSQLLSSGKCKDNTGSSPGKATEKSWEFSSRRTIRIASTPVSHFRLDGSHDRSSTVAPSTLSPSIRYLPATLVPEENALQSPRETRPSPSVGRVPSLFELSLRRCSTVPCYNSLHNLLPIHSPQPVMRGLTEACKAVEEGGRKCSVCGKSYILPGAEWIEYWHCMPEPLSCSAEELFFPFLRRTCSSGCALSNA